MKLVNIRTSLQREGGLGLDSCQKPYLLPQSLNYEPSWTLNRAQIVRDNRESDPQFSIWPSSNPHFSIDTTLMFRFVLQYSVLSMTKFRYRSSSEKSDNSIRLVKFSILNTAFSTHPQQIFYSKLPTPWSESGTHRLAAQSTSNWKPPHSWYFKWRKFDPVSSDIWEKPHWLPIWQTNSVTSSSGAFAERPPAYLCEKMTPLSAPSIFAHSVWPRMEISTSPELEQGHSVLAPFRSLGRHFRLIWKTLN